MKAKKNLTLREIDTSISKFYNDNYKKKTNKISPKNLKKISNILKKENNKCNNKSFYKLIIKTNSSYLNLNILFIILLMMTIIKTILCDNYIIITIQGSGEKNIISAEVDDTYLPSNIQINSGELITSPAKLQNLESEQSTIKMIWDNPLTTCTKMFRNLNYIISIDLSHFDFSSVVNMESFFEGCTSLLSVDLSNANAVNVDNMKLMFKGCTSLISVDFTNYQTNALLYLGEMFMNCHNIISIDFGTKFNTPNLFGLVNTFRNCYSLKYLNINSIQTSTVQRMCETFKSCTSLESLDLSNFNTQSVYDMNSMFQECESLKYLNLSNFRTPALIAMGAMFSNCHNLEYLDISNFNTERVEFMNQVFDQCWALKSLDLSHFNTKALIRMYNMFFNCKALEYLDISNFNTEKVDNMENLFWNCNSLKSLNLSSFNTALVTKMNAMFVGCNSLETLDISSFNTESVTIMASMFNGCKKLKSLDLKHFHTQNLKDMNALFLDCNALESLDVSNFDTTQVTDMSSAFQGCHNLNPLNLGSFTASSLVKMSHMFDNCRALVSLDLHNFNTPNLEVINDLFAGCEKLESLDISNLNTSKTTDMTGLFYNCQALKSLNIQNFDTKLVTSMSKMFFGCKELTTLDLSNFNTELVIYMNQMFESCKKLTNLDLANFYTPSLKQMSSIFSSCENIEWVNISNFNTSSVTTISAMFWHCLKLTSIDLDNFVTNSVVSMHSLFDNCQSLTSVNISHFDTSNVVDFGHMFDQCHLLTSLDLSNFNTNKMTNIDNMFYNCHSLEYLDVTSFNTEKITNMNNLFIWTSSLKFLNLSSFTIYNTTEVVYILYGTKEDIILCYNETKMPSNFLEQVTGLENSCQKLCIMNNKKYILDIEMCVDNCYNEEHYKFEYNVICYSECPIRTQLKTDSTYLCEDCRKYYNYEQTRCIETIPEGYYNNDTKTIDKCPDKCKTCSLESISNENLCTSCNINEYYYPKSTETINTNYECYYKDDEQIGYYLDTEENIFKPCYDKCKTCSLESYNNNLCTLCNIDDGFYPKLNDISNINSFYQCYDKNEEQIGYYLDNEENIFKPCYEKCKTCNGEGNDISNNCLECNNDDNLYNITNGNCVLFCPKYYNYEQTECIDTIQDGYYNNDTSAKTIDKCPDKCNTCTLESISNENLCTSCNINDYYYPKSSEIINTNYECYYKDDEQIGYYLDTEENIYKPCYDKCKTCDRGGDDTSNNCLECKDDHNYVLELGNCNIKTVDSTNIIENEINNIESSNIITNYVTNLNILDSSSSSLSEIAIINTENIIKNENITPKYDYKYSYDIMSPNSDEAKKNNSHTYIEISLETLDFLKNKFNLKNEDKIFVEILEDTKNDSASVTTDYIYEYYLENGTILNLSSIEEDVYVDVYVPIKDLESAKFDLTKEFADQGYDIYDKNSEFYTDFCTPASTGDNDITLADRKKDIYPNVTLCKSNCKYSGINIEEQRVICSCNLNADKNEDEDELIEEDDGNFLTYFLDNINYKIFKCYNLFFNIKNLKKSYPFYIILIIFIIIQIFNCIYIFHTIEKLKIYMVKEMPANKRLLDIINLKPNEKANPVKKQKDKIINKDKRRYSKSIRSSSKSDKNIFICVLNNNNKQVQNELNDEISLNYKHNKKNSCDNFLNKDKETCNNDLIIQDNINDLPYSKAIHVDKRNIFYIYYSFIIEKLELISIFCSNNKIKIILFIEYILSLLINFFINSLLYSDDVISNKYHNNGELDIIVTLTLSILSNIVTSILCYYIKYSRGIEERISLINEIKYKRSFYRNLKKFILYLRIKFICFYLAQLIIIAVCLYYIVIFCTLYSRSQESLIINYCYSLVESIITSFAISLIILLTRKIGIACLNKELYNVSKYIDSKF